MSWNERLLENIILTSPNGNEFIAKWRSSTDPQSKVLGTFKTVAGNFGRVQDLGADLRTTNFSVFFDGDDCDILAENFMSTLSEVGYWTILHPVRGKLINQLPLSFSPNHDPIGSGNIVEITTSWITDYPDEKITSQLQIANEINENVNEVNENAKKDFLTTIRTVTKNLKQKVNDVTNLIETSIDSSLGELTRAVQGVSELILSIEIGITSTLGALSFDAASFVSQIHALCQAPAKSLQGIQGAFSAYQNTLLSISSSELSGTFEEKRAQAITTQLGSCAIFAGLVLTTIGNPQIKTRSQAIELAQKINDTFLDMTKSLDDYAEQFIEFLVYEKYFSQTNTFSSAWTLVNTTIKYLLFLSNSLKIEKTVILESSMPTILACLKYYKNADDENFNLLIESNNLSIDEIILLPAGKELIIYV